MGFLHPELLLLALPAAWLCWRARAGRGVLALRLVLCAALVLAIATPYLETSEQARELVVVADRSRSMPAEGDATALELIALAEGERRAGDRVGVVSFGADVALERLPAADARFGGFQRPLDRDGSDVGAALETALELIPGGKPGAILLVSDGEGNGRDPLDVARRAFARGVRIDVRHLPRRGENDLSVERFDLPDEVARGEPFQFTAWVRSDARVETSYVLERGGERLASGTRVFEPGLNRLVFRDRVERPGVAEYRLRVESAGDPTPENDAGLGALRVAGARPVLLVNDDGAEDSLARALAGAGIPIEISAPEAARLDRVGLASVRAVVLENVAAGRLPSGSLSALRDFVLERGGGLLLTGGKASFGVGGYHLSAIDEVLPVSMEMRQERRKQGVALAIAMDRSGSMSVEVSPGVQKMDLANLGAAAAIELLSPLDSVGVIAIDSAAHVIQELAPVEDVTEIVSRVKRVRSMGGGIFVYTALRAAGEMLEDAPQKNRHVILFADAADSEEQERCPELVEALVRMGTTLSVIALGSETDSDAEFLRKIASIGQGQIYFTHEPDDLPRLFAQDTLTIARATFVEDPTPARALADLFGLGELPGGLSSGAFPTLDGHNVTYLRPEAVAGVVTADEDASPVFAFAYRGLGRTAAFTGQVGGTFGRGVVEWEGFAPFFVTAVRWLAGQEEPGEYFTGVRREGRDAVLSVELDPAAPTPVETASLSARVTAPDGTASELALERVGENRFEARYPLRREGVALGTVQLGDKRFVSLPPIALPYSPEFERGPDAQRGERLLRRIAQESGGEVGVAAGNLFRGPRDAKAWRVVTRELLALAVGLLLLEIAARRLELFARVRVPERVVRAARPIGAMLRRRLSRRRPEPVPTPPPATVPPAGAPIDSPRAEPASSAVETRAPSMSSALEKARRAAERKLGR